MKIFNELAKLKEEAKISIVDIQGVEVEVKEFLSTMDKYWVVRTAVEAAYDDSKSMFDSMYSEVIFDMQLVKYYTNVELDEELYGTGDNVYLAYDVFKESGLLDSLYASHSAEIKEMQEKKGLHLAMLLEQQKSMKNLQDILGIERMQENSEVLDKLKDPEIQSAVEDILAASKEYE